MSGKKYDKGKPQISLIPPDALIEVAKALSFGAEKYDAHNWRKGISTSRLMDAGLRHDLEFLALRDFDDESGLHHLAHSIVNRMMALQQILEGKTNLDDRYNEALERGRLDGTADIEQDASKKNSL